jgi:hypothetical protein
MNRSDFPPLLEFEGRIEVAVEKSHFSVCGTHNSITIQFPSFHSMLSLIQHLKRIPRSHLNLRQTLAKFLTGNEVIVEARSFRLLTVTVEPNQILARALGLAIYRERLNNE